MEIADFVMRAGQTPLTHARVKPNSADAIEHAC